MDVSTFNETWLLCFNIFVHNSFKTLIVVIVLLQNCFEENTFKQCYYYAGSDDEDKTQEPLKIFEEKPPKKQMKRNKSTESLDNLFEVKQIKKRKLSSSVSRAHQEGGNVFITTNEDDGPRSNHMIKIEVYNMHEINKIAPTEQWKHASYRVKYFTNESNNNYESIKKIIYCITKEIASKPTCKKYHFNK